MWCQFLITQVLSLHEKSCLAIISRTFNLMHQTNTHVFRQHKCLANISISVTNLSSLSERLDLKCTRPSLYRTGTRKIAMTVNCGFAQDDVFVSNETELEICYICFKPLFFDARNCTGRFWIIRAEQCQTEPSSKSYAEKDDDLQNGSQFQRAFAFFQKSWLKTIVIF